MVVEARGEIRRKRWHLLANIKVLSERKKERKIHGPFAAGRAIKKATTSRIIALI